MKGKLKTNTSFFFKKKNDTGVYNCMCAVLFGIVLLPLFYLRVLFGIILSRLALSKKQPFCLAFAQFMTMFLIFHKFLISTIPVCRNFSEKL